MTTSPAASGLPRSAPSGLATAPAARCYLAARDADTPTMAMMPSAKRPNGIYCATFKCVCCQSSHKSDHAGNPDIEPIRPILARVIERWRPLQIWRVLVQGRCGDDPRRRSALLGLVTDDLRSIF